jgi:hypothetical protein
VDVAPTSEPVLTICAETGDATASLASLAVWGYTVAIVALALVPIVLIARNLSLAARARRTHGGQIKLRPGLAVLEGTVDHPYDPPLRVEITQTGTEVHLEGRGRWFQWTERERKLSTAPFRLRVGHDEVDVVPDDQTRLMLEMDRTEGQAGTVRRRIAEVRDGDTIHISGKLEVTTEVDPTAGGYRGAASRKRFVLRPSGAGMLVSKRPLDDVFLHPIRQYGAALGLLALVALVVHGLFGGYHARVASGEVLAAEVLDKRVTLDSEGNKNHWLDVRLPDGTTLEAGPTAACYGRVAKGDHVPLLVPREHPSLWQIGSVPSVNIMAVFGGFVALVVGLILYILILRASMRWHGGRLLDEQEGPLTTGEATPSPAGQG